MMSNYHARTATNLENFRSKKALREALAADPKSVVFTDTSAFGSKATVYAEKLSPIDVVVGPDPYTDRRWYANVKNGKVV